MLLPTTHVNPGARTRLYCALLLACIALPAGAQDARDAAPAPQSEAEATRLDTITVTGRRQNLVGEAISASEGIVGQSDI